MSRQVREHPEQSDSISCAFRQLFDVSSRENERLAMEYASVPSGLKRVYMVRLSLPKDTLKAVLDRIPGDMRDSFYGRCIARHIETEQLKEGDVLRAFPCVDVNGENFNWKETSGKTILLLYGGLECMGKSGREYLRSLNERTARSCFQIIVYYPVSSLENLEKVKEKYPEEFIFISDFKQDASPIKVDYGSQATPTCYLFGADGKLKVKSVGLSPALFDVYIK